MWIDDPRTVTESGMVLTGHPWLNKPVCRYFPAVGFVVGTVRCWQPPTPDGDPPLWHAVRESRRPGKPGGGVAPTFR